MLQERLSLLASDVAATLVRQTYHVCALCVHRVQNQSAHDVAVQEADALRKQGLLLTEPSSASSSSSCTTTTATSASHLKRHSSCETSRPTASLSLPSIGEERVAFSSGDDEDAWLYSTPPPGAADASGLAPSPPQDRLSSSPRQQQLQQPPQRRSYKTRQEVYHAITEMCSIAKRTHHATVALNKEYHSPPAAAAVGASDKDRRRFSAN